MQAGLQAAISGGLYSPQDRQIDPRVFTHALIQAARQRGVQFHFQQPVLSCKVDQHRVKALYTPEHTLSTEAVILTAGLGSSSLGAQLGCQIPLRPVKGQAVQVYARDLSLGPVVTHDDVHCVPLADGSIWIGATVEFEPIHPEPTLAGLHSLIARAQWICPALSEGKLLHSWTGQRPRPVNQRAPILGFSPTVSNVVIATGHYRNGILLAPVTAQIVGDLVTGGSTQICDISFFRPNSANQQA
jgi:glycine/D-amino acid oxidase-like deaminating enzyme